MEMLLHINMSRVKYSYETLLHFLNGVESKTMTNLNLPEAG